jgi:hypothetical protein
MQNNTPPCGGNRKKEQQRRWDLWIEVALRPLYIDVFRLGMLGASYWHLFMVCALHPDETILSTWPSEEWVLGVIMYWAQMPLILCGVVTRLFYRYRLTLVSNFVSVGLSLFVLYGAWIDYDRHACRCAGYIVNSGTNVTPKADDCIEFLQRIMPYRVAMGCFVGILNSVVLPLSVLQLCLSFYHRNSVY